MNQYEMFKGFDGGLEMDPFTRLPLSEKTREILAKHDPELDGFYDNIDHVHLARIEEAPFATRVKLIEAYANRLALAESTGNVCVMDDFWFELRSGLAEIIKPASETAPGTKIKSANEIVAGLEIYVAGVDRTNTRFDRFRYMAGMNVD